MGCISIPGSPQKKDRCSVGGEDSCRGHANLDSGHFLHGALAVHDYQIVMQLSRIRVVLGLALDLTC